MIEAKKLAYADMLRYVGDQKFAKTPVAAMLSKEHAKGSREVSSTRPRPRATSSRRFSTA